MIGLAGAIEEVYEDVYHFINTLFDTPLVVLYLSVIGIITTLAVKRATIT